MNLDELLKGDATITKEGAESNVVAGFVWEVPACGIVGSKAGEEVEVSFGRLYINAVNVKDSKDDKKGVTLNLELMPKMSGVDEKKPWKPVYAVANQGYKMGMYKPDKYMAKEYMSYPEAWAKFNAYIATLGGFSDGKVKMFKTNGTTIETIIPEGLAKIFDALSELIDDSKQITLCYTVENGKITQVGITKYKSAAKKSAHKSPIL